MKAIALISGGLDSVLAAKLIKDQGVEVIGLNFKNSFGHSRQVSLTHMASDAGIKIETVDISNDFLGLLRNPRYGFGSNSNPCIDCKILMLDKARELMHYYGASFVITGEVLGQRPMSQHRRALKIIEEDSGLSKLLLRPLSARLLEETIPEQNGWVDRNKLLSFSGRVRRPQMELAKKHGIINYSKPGGGCLLTDHGFSQRLKDLIAQGELNASNIETLKVGRHFRLANNVKLIVGRNEDENSHLISIAQETDYLFSPDDDSAGPNSLGRGNFNDELIRLAASITCRYCDSKASKKIRIECRGKVYTDDLTVSAADEDTIYKLRI